MNHFRYRDLYDSPWPVRWRSLYDNDWTRCITVIRQRARTGELLRDLACDYAVPLSIIRRIVRRGKRYWGWWRT